MKNQNNTFTKSDNMNCQIRTQETANIFPENNITRKRLSQKSVVTFTMLILFIITLTACGKKPSETKNKMGGNSRVKVKTTSVVVQTLQLQNVDEFAEITGTLEGIYDVDLMSEVSGKIVSISKNLGDKVNAGEKIAKIDNEELSLQVAQAKANTLSAKARYDSEQIKYQISEQLYAKKSISEVEYITAKSSFETAKASYDGAKANEELAQRKFNNSLFIAPFSGKIAALPIKIGQYIGMGTKVASIVDDSKMIIRTGVGPSLIQKIHKGEKVCITTQTGNQSCNGKIVGIGATPGSDNFNYPIEIEVENNLNFLSGQLINGTIKVSTYENVIAINPSSIKSFYDRDYVYVIDSESKAQKRDVVIETEISEKVIIKSGLQAGDSLVIQGFESIKENAKVSVKNISTIKTSSAKGE